MTGTGWTQRLTMLALMLCSGLACGGQDPLAAQRWERRVLLLAAPDAADPRLRAFADILARAECEVRERDLIVIELIPGDSGRVDDERMSAAAAEALRARFGLAAEAFTVVLIGKDGGEKLRTEQPDLAAIFARIDGMPMRRREMAQRPRACE